MKKGIFLFALVIGNAFANNIIYCPAYIICKNDQCSGFPVVNPAFNQIANASHPGKVLPEGYYHFSYALALKYTNLQCAYHDSKGYLRAYFTTSTNLSPYVLIGGWNSNRESCYLNRNNPEWADPRNCPFIAPN